MAKKITLTVNENLFAKIDEWRSSFNLSRLFQEAVAEAIKKKEEFQRMLSGTADIPKIVERLKAEKRGSLEKAAAAGKTDGSAWAGHAHYEELVIAVAAISSMATVMPGDEKTRIEAESKSLEAWELRHGLAGMGGKEREDACLAYRDGWRTGVSGLWDLVKEKLDDI